MRIPVVDVDQSTNVLSIQPTFEDILGYLQDVRSSLITISRGLIGNDRRTMSHLEQDIVNTLLALAQDMDKELSWMIHYEERQN